MNKQVIALGSLLALSLVGSYLSWTSEDAGDADDTVLVLDAKAEQIRSVLWEKDEDTAQIQVRSDDLGRYLWVTTTEQKTIKKPVEVDEEPALEPPGAEDEGAEEQGNEDEGSDDEGSEEAVELVETVVEEFKAGKEGDALLESLAPLRALRRLEAGGELADYGLDEPEARVTVEREGKDPRSFEVGGTAYGTRDRYIRDSGDGSLYLVEKDTFRALRSAGSRLEDRELDPVETGDIVRVIISDGSRQLVLEQRNRQDPAKAFWAPVGAEEADEAAATWLDKVLALKARGYVQADEVPTGLQERVSVSVEREDGTVITRRLSQGTDPAGKASYYAISEHTRQPVSLLAAQAGEIVEDLDTILDADE